MSPERVDSHRGYEVLVIAGQAYDELPDYAYRGAHRLLVRTGAGVPVVEEIGGWVSSEPAN